MEVLVLAMSSTSRDFTEEIRKGIRAVSALVRGVSEGLVSYRHRFRMEGLFTLHHPSRTRELKEKRKKLQL